MEYERVRGWEVIQPGIKGKHGPESGWNRPSPLTDQSISLALLITSRLRNQCRCFEQGASTIVNADCSPQECSFSHLFGCH